MIAHSIQKLSLAKGQKVICAVSGGVDSMVLLDALQNHGFNVIVAHINHQLRPESKDEALWLENEVKKRRLTFEKAILNLDRQKNIQNQGHWKRLNFYQELALKHDTTFVFLAHHLNDQLEHFLMKLIRGDQPYAWSGMKRIRSFFNLTLYRPFLDIPKTSIIDYAKQNSIPYIEDSSNQTLKYFRNQIRHLLIPRLIEENPNILKSTPLLLELFDKTFKLDFKIYHNQGFSYIDGGFFKTQSRIHQDYILHSLLHTLKPSIYFTEKQLEMMHKRLSKDESSVRFKITGSTYLIRQYQMLGVYDTSAFKDCLIELNQVGTYPLDADRHIIVSLEKIRRPHLNQLELCYNKITFPITIRNPIEGDIMRFPYGHKRVSKILSDYKIPSPLRHSSLLVETKEGVQGILTLGVHNQSPCTSQKIYIYEVMNVA